MSEEKKIEEKKPEEEELLDLSKSHISRDSLEKLLGFKIIKIDLYKRALVHKSVQKHVKLSLERNLPVEPYMKESLERLEFLGDSVLGLIATNLVYDRYPNADEGFMTRLKIKLVSGVNCAKLAKVLGIGSHILIANPKMQDSNGVIINNSVLEDSLEALVGAIYKDLGFKHAELFVTKLINENINFDELCSVDDNYKDILMRYTQTYQFDLPEYRLIPQGPQGPLQDNEQRPRRFTIHVYLNKKSITKEDGSVITFGKKLYGIATESVKKTAEQSAAKDCMCFAYKTGTVNLCPIRNCRKIHLEELDKIIKRQYEPKE